MSHAPTLLMQGADWLNLFFNYVVLSLMSVGGAISTLPEMHRYLVDQQHWLTSSQFNASVAIAQAAPGPNVLFVALMGWNVGLNAGGIASAILGATITMGGILLPSSILAYLAAHWGQQNRELRPVRAFKQGMSPIVVSLMLSTGWILASAHGVMTKDWPLWLLTVVTIIVMTRKKLSILWLLAAGAVLGWFGLV